MTSQSHWLIKGISICIGAALARAALPCKDDVVGASGEALAQIRGCRAGMRIGAAAFAGD